MNDLTHLDVNTTGDLTPAQFNSVKNSLLTLASKTEFSQVCFYINSEYVGGRKDDRG